MGTCPLAQAHLMLTWLAVGEAMMLGKAAPEPPSQAAGVATTDRLLCTGAGEKLPGPHPAQGPQTVVCAGCIGCREPPPTVTLCQLGRGAVGGHRFGWLPVLGGLGAVGVRNWGVGWECLHCCWGGPWGVGESGGKTPPSETEVGRLCLTWLPLGGGRLAPCMPTCCCLEWAQPSRWGSG